VQSMYPSLSTEFLVKELDTILAEYASRATGPEDKKRRNKTRDLCLHLLVFLLEHNLSFIDLGKQGGRVYLRCTQGTPIGSVCSTDIANLSLLKKEIEIYKHLRAKQIKLLLQRRFIDDGSLLFISARHRIDKDIQDIKWAYDNLIDPGIKMDWEEAGQNKGSRLDLNPQPGNSSYTPFIDYLDIQVRFKATGIQEPPRSRKRTLISLEYMTFKKSTAGDLYIHFNSNHQGFEKLNLPRNQRTRFLLTCSHEQYFNNTWYTFKQILLNRGYPEKELRKMEKDITWDMKDTIKQARAAKAADKKRKLHSYTQEDRGNESWLPLSSRKGAEDVLNTLEQARTNSHFTIPPDMQKYHFLTNINLARVRTPDIGTFLSKKPPHKNSNRPDARA